MERTRGRGSPPRVWGRRKITDRSPSGGSVHPHACGDDVDVPGSFVGRSGSPPRVWGRLARISIDQDLKRFTPTRVGTTG